MLAIYKRELKSYLTSMVGYLFMFFVLLIAGIYFSAYQLSAAYPKFEYTLNAMTFVFLIAPVSVSGIVMGKYLALVTIYAIPIAVLATYPLIMSKFGTVAFGSAYTALLGFFLLGSANIAIGVFFSAITESQVIAAVLTFVFLFAFYMMNGISSFFSETAMSTCVTFGILIIALSLMIYSMIKNAVISGAVCVIGEVALVIVYVVKSSVFEGGIQKVLEVFNLSSHFENFTNSIFDVTGVLYFLSVIAICIFLTMQTILKRRWN